jgi:hypothetical protein
VGGTVIKKALLGILVLAFLGLGLYKAPEKRSDVILAVVALVALQFKLDGDNELRS